MRRCWLEKKTVVEIGCGDGIGIPIMAQFVQHLHCIDWDERNLEGCARRLKHLKNVTYELIDLNTEIPNISADAIYLVDVIEHVELGREQAFMNNLCSFLKTEGVLIMGTPNITTSAYASKSSAEQHVNLKSQSTLRDLMLQYFIHEFSFGMNDEVLHIGYAPMCHYLWSIGAQKRAQ